MSEYTKQAEKFLAKYGIEFRAVLVGDDCPMFCEDAAMDRELDKVNVFPRKSHIHGKHYRCTFSAKGRGHLTVDFWNSYRDEEENAYNFGLSKRARNIPTPYDVLSCIQKTDVGTFHDFCGDFGYDEDSRKAETGYQEVCKEYQKVRKFFTDSELAEAQEIN